MMGMAWALGEAVAIAGGNWQGCGGPQVSTPGGNDSSLARPLILCNLAWCDNSPVSLFRRKLPLKAQESVQVSGSPLSWSGSQLSKWVFLLAPTMGPRLFGGTTLLRWAVGPQALSGPPWGLRLLTCVKWPLKHPVVLMDLEIWL